jgi:hypothetical protein
MEGAVPQVRKSSVKSYRQRMKRRGLVRVEVQVRREDAGLVRGVASALADPDREAETRALLREKVSGGRPKGLKALLASAPLEGIEIERSRDTGRALDL